MVLLDFSTAFGIIDHNILITKFDRYGFSCTVFAWMISYLRDHRMSFLVVAFLCRQMTCGVPHGSCLGPLFYYIYTNDLPLTIQNSTVVVYADDTTLYITASTINELEAIMNLDLEKVSSWVKNNKLVLNISKTKCIIFGSRSMVIVDPGCISQYQEQQ